jgi:nitrous oxidase accessory protein NosD
VQLPIDRRALLALSVAACTIGAAVATAMPASAHESHGQTLYVRSGATASARADDEHHASCNKPDFATISAAVAAASRGSTVIVCRGTYTEDVLVNKSLHLVGRHATIDATGLENAMQVVRSWTSVSGFRLENANGEGLLVGVDSAADAGLLPHGTRVISHVSISRVAAVHDNKGFNGTEQGNCKYGGDCGGGIHLNVTKWSSVRDSFVTNNADGILLTDDYGPNSHNLIEGNYVADNKTECGIVLPSHSSTAVTFDPKTFTVTGRKPSLGGVFDNVVRDNITVRNGTAPAPPQFGGVGGSGSGIGLFGSGPGSAVYDNLVEHNITWGNGLAGITIHAHHPGGEDVNGNQFVENIVGRNNVGGDPYDGPPGPTDFKTTGIAVFSVPPVHMTIRDNTIFNNRIGIWLSKTVTAHGLHDNTFVNVTTDVVTG